VVVVVHGRQTHQVVPRELAECHLKVATHMGTELMGLPKRLVVVEVQAEQVLRRCTTTAVQVELELQVP
jgi:hypothetical protein